MTYQKTTYTSWGNRLASAFMGTLIGISMFVGGTVLLYWNEGDFIKTRTVINQADEALISIDSVKRVDSSLNGKLIHATAKADTQDQLHDRQFDVNINAIALKRRVQYYQWVEHSRTEERNQLGGGKETVITYSYEQQWVGEPVDSDDFEDPYYRGLNHIAIDTNDQILYAETVHFGGYRLPQFLVEKIDDNTAFDIQLPTATDSMIVSGNQIYIGKNPKQPSIGDVRVTFTAAFPAPVSIIAQVSQDSFEPFISPDNQYEFSSLAMGRHSAAAMIADAHSDNKLSLWSLRGAGILANIIGLMLLLKPLTALARVLPPLGSLVELLSVGVAGIIGLAWSIAIIAIGWLRFRPLIGGTLLVIVVVLIASSLYRKKQKIKANAPPPPPITH